MIEATKDCKYCGATLRQGATYCEACGQPVNVEATPVTYQDSVIPPVLENTPPEASPASEIPESNSGPDAEDTPVPETPPGSVGTPPPPPYTPGGSYVPFQPKKQKFPIWVIIVIILVGLCLCLTVVVGAVLVFRTASSVRTSGVMETAVQIVPDFSSEATVEILPNQDQVAPTNTSEPQSGLVPYEAPNTPEKLGDPYLTDTEIWDDFSSTQFDWAEAQELEGSQGYEDGRYYINVTETSYMMWGYVPGDFIPTHMDFDAQLAQGYENNGTLGLMCNFQNNDEYNYVDIDLVAGKVQLGVSTLEDMLPLTDEEWVPLTGFNLEVNAINHYEFTCNPSSMSISVNGQAPASVQISDPYPEGWMALYAFTWEDSDPSGAKVYFDNVHAWKE